MNFILQAKNTANKAMRGMSKTLMSDVMVPEAHHNDHSYVRELCGLAYDSQSKNLVQGTLSQTISKNHKNYKKLEGGHFLRVGCLPGTIR